MAFGSLESRRIQIHDMESMPFWQRTFRGYVQPIARVILASLAAFTVLEWGERFMLPDLTQQQADAVTILIGTFIVGLVASFSLHKTNILYQRLIEENQHRKQTEDELIHQKEWFRFLTEHGTDLLTVIDPQGSILYESPSLERILGYTPIERLGKNAFMHVHPDDVERAKGIAAGAFRHPGAVRTAEMRVRAKDGQWRSLEVTGRAIMDQAGKFCGVMNVRDVGERKQMEDRLREQEKQYRLLFEESPLPMYVFDEDTLALLAANQAAERLYGYTRGEFAVMNLAELRPPAEVARLKEFLHRTRTATGSDFSEAGQWRHRKKDGTLFDVEISHAFVNFDGRPARFVIARDITERKEAHEAIRRAHEMLHQIVNNIPQHVFWKDRQSVYLGCNRLFAEAAGVPGPEAITGKNDFELAWRKSADRYRSDDRLVMETNTPKLDYEEPMVRPDGSILTLRTSKVPLLDRDGKAFGVLGIYADITEEKRVQEKVRLQAAALEAAANGIIITDRSGAIVWVNPAVSRLTGYSTGELLGQNPRLLKSGMQDASFYKNLWSTIQAGKTWHGELTNRRNDGSFYTEEQTITPVRDAQGTVTHFIGIKQDITERKLMESQARRNEQLAALGQLLGGIAHEIKNPLFIVTGRLQLLKEMVAHREYDAMEKSLPIIENACKRMMETTQRFLSLARPASSQPQQCSVNDILRQTLDFLANQLMKDRIRVIRNYDESLPQIWTEPRKVHEIFMNLIMNAMQAMTSAHGEGTLTITTGARHDSLTVRIADDGPGIPAACRPRLFEPFFSTKPPGEGTGLGLWTVRSMATELGGSAACESEEGKGTAFTITLPLASESKPAGILKS